MNRKSRWRNFVELLRERSLARRECLPLVKSHQSTSQDRGEFAVSLIDSEFIGIKIGPHRNLQVSVPATSTMWPAADDARMCVYKNTSRFADEMTRENGKIVEIMP
jgi:hypothetical protein